MTWQDRTRQAAYVSPRGNRFVFDFETIDKSFDKNTSAYNFPGVRGTFVQDLGSTDLRYPFRVIFWGDNHDRQAAAFQAALRETGRGRLEHPRDGRVVVVPFGPVTVREDLVRRANQTVFEVEFWESTSILFPSGSTDAGLSVLNSATAVYELVTNSFISSIDLGSQNSIVTLRNDIAVQTARVVSALTPIVSINPVLLQQFNNVADSINSALPLLASDPLTIASQMTILLDIPSRVGGDVTAQLNGYGEVITAITGAADPISPTPNQFLSAELTAMSATAASIKSAARGDFQTRPQAVTAAVITTGQFDAVNTWREINYA